MRPGRLHPLLWACFAANLALVAVYWSFTAEDAFIVYRYAENLVDGYGLVFNHGERIDALTSPFHALLGALAYAVTGATPLANKVLGELAVLGACAFALGERRYPLSSQLVFGVLVLLSPFVVLWTVGGLETPFLLAWMTLALVLAGRSATGRTPRRDAAFSLVLGLAFLTRFDSVVVSVPLLAAVAWRRLQRDGARVLPALLLPGGMLAFAWLAFSQLYFGDFLPTSFYHKTPKAEHLFHNVLYIGQTLIVSGAVWLAPLAAWRARRARQSAPAAAASAGAETERDRRAVTRGALVGLAALLVYALPTATTHMMFGYRLFVPYLPLAVLALLDVLEGARASEASAAAATDAATGRARRSWGFTPGVAAATAVWLGLQAFLATGVELTGVNPGVAGEYRGLSRRGYVAFMALLARQADEIAQHWSRHGDPSRPPRIFVYAAGVVPYRLRDAHILDNGLVSFRHAYHGNQLLPPLPASSDYVMTLSPYLGSPERQLQYEPERFVEISDAVVDFDGEPTHFRVYHNPKPTSWRLPEKIDGRADLRAARLAHHVLPDLKLRGADLRDAELRGADLSGADLRDARLGSADLAETLLDGADLRGSDLRGADLRGSRGLEPSRLDGACGDARTRLPPGLTVPPCP